MDFYSQIFHFLQSQSLCILAIILIFLKDFNHADIQLGATAQGFVVFQNSVKINTFSWLVFSLPFLFSHSLGVYGVQCVDSKGAKKLDPRSSNILNRLFLSLGSRYEILWKICTLKYL